jgi:hypothetical protein
MKEMVRHAVCCDPVRRTFTHFAKSTKRADDGSYPTIQVQEAEIVYQHDVYRPKDVKGKVLSIYFWRGARITPSFSTG